MNKLSLFLSIALPSVITSTKFTVTPSDVLNSMNIVNGYYMNNNPTGDCGWTRGTYYAGSSAHYLTSWYVSYICIILSKLNLFIINVS